MFDCVCKEKRGSRRSDVGLMRDALTPLVVSQGGGVVCDEWVLVLLLQWRRRAAALVELAGQLVKLL